MKIPTKPNLTDQVEWISRDAGDGAGFDILSKNENGSDRSQSAVDSRQLAVPEPL